MTSLYKPSQKRLSRLCAKTQVQRVVIGSRECLPAPTDDRAGTVGTGTVDRGTVHARSRAEGDAHAKHAPYQERGRTVAAPLSATPSITAVRPGRTSTSKPSTIRNSIPPRDGIHRPAGRPRRLLTGLIVCGRCGRPMRASPRTRHEMRGSGPERLPFTFRQPRYVCPTGHLAILAEPTERILAVAVTHRRGSQLPTGRERQRVAIAAVVDRIEVRPGRPGASAYDPCRLRVTFADGTTRDGAPSRRPRPGESVAMYDQAGAVLARGRKQ